MYELRKKNEELSNQIQECKDAETQTEKENEELFSKENQEQENGKLLSKETVTTSPPENLPPFFKEMVNAFLFEYPVLLPFGPKSNNIYFPPPEKLTH